MEWLNYNHLLYFWVVAREGGLTQAGKVLKLSHPTLSAQVHALEERMGARLFEKSGRRLVLTETGRLVFRYADEIFTIGRELLDTVSGRSPGQAPRVNIGIADAVPKMVVRRLLEPALADAAGVRLVCREGSFEQLLGDLALHSLDVVISDAPVPPGSAVRAFHHLLGETGTTFFASPKLVALSEKPFPEMLDGAPMLLPVEGLTLRRALNVWFERHRLQPRVVSEFEDSALLKSFGAGGLGIFAAPTVIEDEVARQYDVRPIGRTEEVRERFYAISVERRLRHPAVVQIFESARHGMFAERGGS